MAELIRGSRKQAWIRKVSAHCTETARRGWRPGADMHAVGMSPGAYSEHAVGMSPGAREGKSKMHAVGSVPVHTLSTPWVCVPVLEKGKANGMKKSYDLLQFGCSASRAGHDVELGLPVLTYGMEWSSASGAEGCKARRGAVTSGPNVPRGCIKPRRRIQGSPQCLSNDLT